MAEAFADAGCALLLADINAQRLAEAKANLGTKAQVITQVVDIRRGDQVEAMADTAFEAFGEVNILCNNAGVACSGLIWQHAPSDWDWIFSTNVRSVVEALHHFVPRMLAQDGEGHIVNTSSMLGLSSAPLAGLYGASKQAVLGISESLRMELMLSGASIGVSVLCPGPSPTNVLEQPGRIEREEPVLPDSLKPVDEALKTVIDDGMAPRAIGDCVVSAVREGVFWVLPSPELIENADARLSEIHSTIGGS